MLNKVFLYLEEEWIVEEILTFGYECSCRNLETDETEIFDVWFAKDKISNYENDLKKLKKDKNAYIIKEDNEKEIIDFMINYFSNNLNLLNLEQANSLYNLNKTIKEC